MTTTNAALYGPAAAALAAATIYTVPASSVAVVQHIHVTNPTTSTVTFTLSIGADAAATRIYDAIAIPSGGQIDVFTKYVLSAAQILQAFASSTAVVIRIDGQLLTPG